MNIFTFIILSVIGYAAALVIAIEVWHSSAKSRKIIVASIVLAGLIAPIFSMVGLFKLNEQPIKEIINSYDIVTVNDKYYYQDEDSTELHDLQDVTASTMCRGTYLVNENPHVDIGEVQWLFLKGTKATYYVLSTS